MCDPNGIRTFAVKLITQILQKLTPKLNVHDDSIPF